MDNSFHPHDLGWKSSSGSGSGSSWIRIVDDDYVHDYGDCDCGYG
jgi:hypothetical protein